MIFPAKSAVPLSASASTASAVRRLICSATSSIVASGYGDDEKFWGSLGIMGPTRMDYPAAIASVRAVARYLGRFLAEG